MEYVMVLFLGLLTVLQLGIGSEAATDDGNADYLWKTAGSEAAHWTYGKHNGPLHWKQSYKYCGGSKQSPINIDTERVEYDEKLVPFRLPGYDTVPEDAQKEMENNGHTLTIKLTGEYDIEGGGLPGIYRAVQIHFHWGRDDEQGSEHTVDGVKYPMEMQIIHYNLKFRSMAEAAMKKNGIAVFSVFYQVHGGENRGYEPIFSNLKNITHQGTSIDLEPFWVRSLLPTNLRNYYRYMGSLSTPPCYESVIWTVFRDPVRVSRDQLDALRTTIKVNKKGVKDLPMVNNYRPIMPINGRTVYTSDEQEGTTDHHMITGLIISVVLAWVFFVIVGKH